MAIPINYIARNLVARRLTTILTAGGMALVVYVFATVLMLAAGLEQTLVSTGRTTTSSSFAAAPKPKSKAASIAGRRALSRLFPTSRPALTGSA